MRRGFAIGAAAALVVALVGGTATVALATDEIPTPEVVQPTLAEVEVEAEQETEVEEEVQEEVQEQGAPLLDSVDQLPLVAPIAPDVTLPVIRIGGIDQEFGYIPGTTFTIWFECEDPESGITSCTEDGGVQSGDVITMTEPGWNTWWVTAVNGDGAVSRLNLQAFVSVYWAEEVRVFFNDGNAEPVNGWYNTPVTVQLTALSLDQFPIRELLANRGAGWVSTRDDEVLLQYTEEGISVLDWYAIDEDVQHSVVAQKIMRLDFTPPSIVATAIEDGAVVHQWAERSLYAECGDELSGLASCEFVGLGDYLPTDVPGAHTVTVRATDRAGNAVERVLRYTVVGDVPDNQDEEPTEEPTESPAPVTPASDGLDTLAFTGATDSGPLVLMAGGLVVIGLAIAGGATLRRRNRAHG